MHKGFFITGTDTEVGKTLVAGAVLLHLAKKYPKVAAYKPVVAGLTNIDGQLQNEDLVALLQACTIDMSTDDMCPYQLTEPAAPHLVANAENRTLSYAHMLEHYQQLIQKTDAMVVEGVGGFMVPLHEGKNTADFAKDIGLPVILVIGMKLGCINHALLTAQVIQQKGLQLAGWVANTGPTPMNLLDQNITSLSTMLNAPLLGVIPQLPQKLAKTPYSKEALETAASHIHIN